MRHHLSEFNILHPNANSRMISLKFQLRGSMCGYVAFSKLPRALSRFMSLPVCGQSFVLLPPGKSPRHACHHPTVLREADFYSHLLEEIRNNLSP